MMRGEQTESTDGCGDEEGFENNFATDVVEPPPVLRETILVENSGRLEKTNLQHPYTNVQCTVLLSHTFLGFKMQISSRDSMMSKMNL